MNDKSEMELRKLDAEVAEKVMGWSLWKGVGACILEPSEYVLSIPQKIVRARNGEKPTESFEPTTNSAAALEVLKRCADKLGYLPEIRPSRIGWAWMANYQCGNAPILEQAICECALALFIPAQKDGVVG